MGTGTVKWFNSGKGYGFITEHENSLEENSKLSY